MSQQLWIEVWRGVERVAEERASLAACTEDAVFRGILAGRLENDGRVPAFDLRVQLGSPGRGTVEAFSLCTRRASAGRYDRSVFASQVHALISEQVAGGRLAREDRVHWDLVARRPIARDAPAFAARVKREPLPLERARLDATAPGTFAIEIDEDLLERLRHKVRDAGPLECASLLTGRLLHDPDRRAGALRVDDCVDLVAGAGGRSGSHFSLSPDSFLAGLEALRARGDERTLAGWHHTHPACEACPRQPDCRTNTVFFSAKDVAVHMTAFARAHNVGLVGGKVAEQPAVHPGFRLYGWHQARVIERPFVVRAPQRRAPGARGREI